MASLEYNEDKQNKELVLNEEEKNFYNNVEEFSDYDRSIFMIGITGAGKSTFCNFLSQKEIFEEQFGFVSCTQVAGSCKFDFQGKDVLIIDCPGFCDSERPDEEIFDELCKVGVMAKDGTDAVAIVINTAERFSENHRNAFQQMQFLGGDFWEHAFIVFTRESEVMRKAKVSCGEEFIEKTFKGFKCPPVLKELIEKTEGRYFCVDSKDHFQDAPYHKRKCLKMFEFIDLILTKNNGIRYSNRVMEQGSKFFKELCEARKNKQGMENLIREMRNQMEEENKRREDEVTLLEEQRHREVEEMNAHNKEMMQQFEEKHQAMEEKFQKEREEASKKESAEREKLLQEIEKKYKAEQERQRLEEEKRRAKAERDRLQKEEELRKAIEAQKLEAIKIQHEAELRAKEQEYKLKEMELKRDNDALQYKLSVQQNTSPPTETGCFSSNTKVLMASGERKNISSIKEGDLIQSNKSVRKVAFLSISKREQLKLYSINNCEFQFDAAHPFRAYNKDFANSALNDTAVAVIDVDFLIDFMPTMAAHCVYSMYDGNTKLLKWTLNCLEEVEITHIKEINENEKENDLLYDLILEPNNSGLNEYFAGDDDQLFLVTAEIPSYDLPSDEFAFPAYVAILPFIQRIGENFNSLQKTKSEQEIITLLTNLIEQRSEELLTKTLAYPKYPIVETDIPKFSGFDEVVGKALMSFLDDQGESQWSIIVLFNLMSKYLIRPLLTIITLEWRIHSQELASDILIKMLAVGVAEVVFVENRGVSNPIKICIDSTMPGERNYMLEEIDSSPFRTDNLRPILNSAYFHFESLPLNKIRLRVVDLISEETIAFKELKLLDIYSRARTRYVSQLLKLRPVEGVLARQIRISVDYRLVSHQVMLEETESRVKWSNSTCNEFALAYETGDKLARVIIQELDNSKLQ